MIQTPSSGNTRAPVPSPPLFPPTRNPFPQAQNVADSPFSTDSSVDATAYATEVKQRMEAAQTVAEIGTSQTAKILPGTAGNMEDLVPKQPSDPRRTSTPTPDDQHPAESSDLSQLEMNLEIVEITKTGFPELQPTTGTSKEITEVSLLQVEEDSTSTFNGSPPLPGKPAQPTGSASEIDTAGKTSGLDNLPPLYGTIPGYSELEPEKRTETELEGYLDSQPGTSRMTAQQHKEPLRELSAAVGPS